MMLLMEATNRELNRTSIQELARLRYLVVTIILKEATNRDFLECLYPGARRT